MGMQDAGCRRQKTGVGRWDRIPGSDLENTIICSRGGGATRCGREPSIHDNVQLKPPVVFMPSEEDRTFGPASF